MAVSNFRHYFLFICLLLCSNLVYGQLTGANAQNNGVKKDTSMAKSNTSKWKSYDARITYTKLNSEKVYTPDTALHTFHRRPFSQPWEQNLGNLGSPSWNMMFTPEDNVGPSLGYHIFDVYRFLPDSLNYYNTNRPWASFSYQQGSKLEQMADIMFTGNVRPNWNFAFGYRKINSPGYYKIQRTNHDNLFLTTNYKSLDKHYELYGGLVYNKEQHDENGGIDSGVNQLMDPNFTDRKTLNVLFENPYYSTTRSSVTNMQRDFTALLQQSYTFGRIDTSYNSDSTQMSTKLIPRFRITQKTELSTEKHEFKDVVPDSSRYVSLFNHGFTNGGTFTQGQDSILSQQLWFWVDNRLMLNGFLGKPGHLLAFSAGAGNRIDQFTTNFGIANTQIKLLNNYLVGEIKKEALQTGQWSYQANAKFFLTGDNAGDFLLHASIAKDLKSNWAGLAIGFQQKLSSAPYSYTIFATEYDTLKRAYDKESITQLFASINSPKLRFSAGVRNYVIDNYIYINPQQRFDQYTSPFNVSQAWLRKVFKLGPVFLDNELVYQQLTGDAPVNIPALMGRHQLSFERSLFKGALKFATGVEVRYHTSYFSPGYDPFFNRFYYQSTYYVANQPEGSAFFNFRIKKFRAYLMVDQIQELFFRNSINVPGYPSQDFMVRFGFTWILVN